MSAAEYVLNNAISFTQDYFRQEDVCRLCWSRDAEEELYYNNRTINSPLIIKVQNCLDIDLTRDNSEYFPKKLCIKCIDTLEQFDKFKVFCQDTNEKLDNILRSNFNEHEKIAVTIKCERKDSDFIDHAHRKALDLQHHHDFLEHVYQDPLDISIDNQKLIDVDCKLAIKLEVDDEKQKSDLSAVVKEEADIDNSWQLSECGSDTVKEQSNISKEHSINTVRKRTTGRLPKTTLKLKNDKNLQANKKSHKNKLNSTSEQVPTQGQDARKVEDLAEDKQTTNIAIKDESGSFFDFKIPSSKKEKGNHLAAEQSNKCLRQFQDKNEQARHIGRCHYSGNISVEDRARIVGMHSCGLNLSEISRKTGFDRKTVRKWVARHKDEGSVLTRHRVGRPKFLGSSQLQYMVDQYKSNGHIPTQEFAEIFGTAKLTIYRALKAEGLNYITKSPRKKSKARDDKHKVNV